MRKQNKKKRRKNSKIKQSFHVVGYNIAHFIKAIINFLKKIFCFLGKIITQPIILTLLLLITVGFSMPLVLKNLKYGLDLQGGFEVLYKIDSIDGNKVTEDMVTSTYKTLLKRIDVLGVSEPEIVVEGTNRIRVGLAGVTDPDAARNQIGKVANLTFRNTKDKLLMKSNVIGGAKVTTDQSGKPAVALTIKNKDTFYNVTKEISESEDKTIVIWLDFEAGKDHYSSEKEKCGSLGTSRCISAATVNEAFSSDVIITGNFTQEEAKSLAELINSGSLQTKLTEISSKTVTASFGEDSLKNTFVAGAIGLIIIILLMIILYRFCGLIASISLVIYTFLTFFIFWLIGGVLTLPGIAAMLLGIGMAIDANVLSFSQIKDELKNGKNLKEAYKIGNKGSFATILDANITTFIVALILFIFGESSVKGFATMLMISIFVTLLIMVGLTRLLLNLFMKKGYFQNKPTMFIGKYNRNKLKVHNSFKYVILSLIIIGIGIFGFAKNGFNLGIDFKGGTSISLKNSLASEKDIESYLTKHKYTIREMDANDNSISVVINESLQENEVIDLKNKFTEEYEGSVDIGVVSNVVKRELLKNAIYSILLATLGIIGYISFRFTFRYAVSAILALLHDILIVCGIFALFKLEVSTIFIAAILSIIGYSINDTVVMFDRIKELKKRKHKNKIKNEQALNDLVDTAINLVAGRSLITSITTMIPIICLLILGSKSILTFNIAMAIGVLVGTYSSLFIAPYIWKLLDKKWLGKEEKSWIDGGKEEKSIKGINC